MNLIVCLLHKILPLTPEPDEPVHTLKTSFLKAHVNVTLIFQHRFLSKHKSIPFRSPDPTCLYIAHLSAVSCPSTWPPSSMA